MRKFIQNLLSSENPTSSKRLVGIVGAFSLIGAMIYYHTNYLVSAVEMVTIGVLTITGAEKIFKK